MKKTKVTFAVVTLLAGAVSGYAQGEIDFAFYNPGAGQVRQSVWGPQSVAASTYFLSYGGSAINEAVGSTSAGPENPKGTTVYSGSGLSGTGYDIQLLAGPAGISTVGGRSSANGANNVGLTPVSSISHFLTTASLLGYMNGVQLVVLPNESYFSQGDQVSLAVAAWDNEGGTVNSLADAIAGDGNLYGVPWGISPVVTTTYASGLPVSSSPAAALPTTLESFSLRWSDAPVVPEPSTIALGIMGASTLLCRRRTPVT